MQTVTKTKATTKGTDKGTEKDAAKAAKKPKPAARPAPAPVGLGLMIGLDKLAADPANVRVADAGGVEELAASLAAHGVIHPLTVRPPPEVRCPFPCG